MPQSPPTETAAPDPGHWVVCLCADWCDLCRSYQDVFAQMAAHYPACRFAWLDIEDQSDLVGDMEVETFPTLLIADAQGTQFLGPLTPHAQTLARLLDSLERSSLQTTPHLPAVQQLLQALRAAPGHWVSA
ncbi:MAG: thioredoxin family protein [Polaromonas sp.]